MASRTKRARSNHPRKFTESSSREESTRSFFDYFRLGESYTSLILGIVVVIITAILLITFVRNRNIGQIGDNNKQISTISTVKASPTPEGSQTPTVSQAPTKTLTPTRSITATPTKAAPTTVKASPTKKPTTVPTKVIAKAATNAPSATKAPTSTPRATSTVKPTNTVVPTNPPAGGLAKATPTPVQQLVKGKTYIVQKGDTLWSISERTYKSGYNWVDISKANKLSNPSVLAVGTKLMLPDVSTKTVVAKTELKPQASKTGPAITGTTYTVVKGDYLWDISIRAYGTGFRYAEIAKANKINNPGLIYAGTKLNIPR